MIKVYAAIGECVIKNDDGYFYPVILSSGREHELSVVEMLVWTRLNHSILTYHEFQKSCLNNCCNSFMQYEEPDFAETLNRLIIRKLVASAEGLTRMEACYELIKNLQIRIVHASFWSRCRNFYLQVFRLKVPVSLAVRLFSRYKYTPLQRFILKCSLFGLPSLKNIIDSIEKQPFKDFDQLKLELLRETANLFYAGQIQFDCT